MLNFFRKKAPGVVVETPLWSAPEGKRIYAIGDIHGRMDLFAKLLTAIESDNAARPALDTHLILLGDLVDRGEDSAAVVARAMELSQSINVRFLMGNHEEVFIRAAQGDVKSMRFFCRIGGRETLLSYGLTPQQYAAMEYEELAEWALNNVPRTHVDFMSDFEDMIEMGDYLFVHAGVRPDVPLEEQDISDLRWIRTEFLDFPNLLPKLVVHGHTITENVDERCNRIGIDTGAYQSGKLTAIGLEGSERWYLATEA